MACGARRHAGLAGVVVINVMAVGVAVVLVSEDAVRIIFVGLAVAVEVARRTRRHINRHQIQSS